MAAIIINISNSKKIGLTNVKRKITINGYTKDYVNSVYTIPYLLEHFDVNDEKIHLIPDVNYTLVADNIKSIWVRANGTTSRVYIDSAQEFKMYDFFQQLQKTYSDQQIISSQIIELDSSGYFDI